MLRAAAIDGKEVGEMRRLAMKLTLVLLVSLALILVLEAGFAFAQEKIKISFRQTHATVKSESVEIGDVKGHYAGFRDRKSVV